MEMSPQMSQPNGYGRVISHRLRGIFALYTDTAREWEREEAAQHFVAENMLFVIQQQQKKMAIAIVGFSETKTTVIPTAAISSMGEMRWLRPQPSYFFNKFFCVNSFVFTSFFFHSNAASSRASSLRIVRSSLPFRILTQDNYNSCRTVYNRLCSYCHRYGM